MKKKNLLVSLLCLALVAVIGVGATLAYFTDKTDTKTNVFTTGKVNIELTDETDENGKGEYEYDPDGNQTGIIYNDVMPGDKLAKRVALTVEEDSSNAHVGIVVMIDETANPSSEELYALVDKAVNEKEKTVGDIWLDPQDVVMYQDGNLVQGKLYAYNPAITGWEKGVPAGTTLNLFDEIKIPTSWDNAYAHSVFDIKVQGYAIQADNLASTQLASAIQGMLRDDQGKAVEFEQVK